MIAETGDFRYNMDGDYMNDSVFLETRRLVIRPYVFSDFDDYYSYIMDPELRFMLGLDDVTDRPSAEAAFQWLLDNREFLALINKRAEKAIGHISIHPPYEALLKDPAFHQKSGCSLSFAIAKSARRKGLMEEALRRLIRELFASRPIDFIDCECTSFNGASQALQKKLGFSFWGREHFGEIELFIHVLENTRG